MDEWVVFGVHVVAVRVVVRTAYARTGSPCRVCLYPGLRRPSTYTAPHARRDEARDGRGRLSSTELVSPGVITDMLA